MCLVHSLRLAFRLYICFLPSLPFIFPLINQFDRCLLPISWGLMAGGRGFTSHRGLTLSRGWFCQNWSPWTSQTPTSTGRHSWLVNQDTVCYTNPVSRLPFFVSCGKKKDLAKNDVVVHSSKSFLTSWPFYGKFQSLWLTGVPVIRELRQVSLFSELSGIKKFRWWTVRHVKSACWIFCPSCLSRVL